MHDHVYSRSSQDNSVKFGHFPNEFCKTYVFTVIRNVAVKYETKSIISLQNKMSTIVPLNPSDYRLNEKKTQYLSYWTTLLAYTLSETK